MFKKILSSLAKIALTRTLKVLFCAHMTRCKIFGKMDEFATVGDALAKAVPTICLSKCSHRYPLGFAYTYHQPLQFDITRICHLFSNHTCSTFIYCFRPVCTRSPTCLHSQHQRKTKIAVNSTFFLEIDILLHFLVR